MKYIAMSLLFVLALALVLPTTASAQMGRRMDPAQQLKMLTDTLGLSKEQAAKVKGVLDEAQKKREDMMANADPTDREAMRAKMQEARQETEKKIKEVLTDEQKVKYDKLLKAQMDNMRRRMGGPGGPGGGQPQ